MNADSPQEEIQRTRTRRELWAFFALTFGISWGVGGLFLILHNQLEPIFGRFGPHNALFFVAAYAPTLSALILAPLLGGWVGLRALLGSLVRSFRPGWLFIAALTIPVLALALAALPMFGVRRPVAPETILVALPILLFTTPQILSNTGPLGEELGWRGYALPRLLQRWNALTAAVILGAVWTLWHVPAFFISGVMGQGFNEFGWWALDTISLSVLITWLYRRANGNVVICGMIPHFVINGMGVVGAWRSRPMEALALTLVAVLIVVLDRTAMMGRPEPFTNR